MRRRTLHALSAALLSATLGAAVVSTATSAQAEGRGDTRITKAVANSGRPVVVGPSAAVSFPIRFWISDSSGVRRLDVETFQATNGLGYADFVANTCEKISTKVSLCTRTVRIDPVGLAGYHDGSANVMAGKWTVYANAGANDGDYWIADDLTRYPVLRQTRATIAPATSTTVAKGRIVTFSGRLQHADWEHQAWTAFGGQKVELRFKKSGASSYATVKTVTTSSRGYMAAKVPANAAGKYRWRFLGTGTNATGVSTETPVRLTR